MAHASRLHAARALTALCLGATATTVLSASPATAAPSVDQAQSRVDEISHDRAVVAKKAKLTDKRLAAAEPVDPAQQKNRDRVFFGATVTYLREDDCDVTVTIVGTDETEMDKRPGEGSRISWVSPVARALMKAAVGDTVVLRSPTGIETLEILAIRYPDA